MKTEEQIHVETLKRRLARIQASLGDMSVMVKRCGDDLDRVGQPTWPSYAYMIRNIQKDLLWALANLHIDALTETASEADVARYAERGAS